MSTNELVSMRRPRVPSWGIPAQGLVLALIAAACSMVSAYARFLLPTRVSSGASLDRFDEILAGSNLLQSSSVALIANCVALLVLILVAGAIRAGVRAYAVHAATILASAGAILGPIVVRGLS